MIHLRAELFFNKQGKSAPRATLLCSAKGALVLRGKWDARRGKQLRDIGTYTAIPMMMVVGPAMGYYLGRLAERKWGHDPWLSTGGAVFGLVAAARQIWLLLKRGGTKS